MQVTLLLGDWVPVQRTVIRVEDLTHYQTTNFRLFQTDGVCRQQFQIDEIGKMFSKRVENTVGNGEIARYEQFLLFPLCFQKTFTPDT